MDDGRNKGGKATILSDDIGTQAAVSTCQALAKISNDDGRDATVVVGPGGRKMLYPKVINILPNDQFWVESVLTPPKRYSRRPFVVFRTRRTSVELRL